MRICSSCSFYSVDVDLPEVHTLPPALSLSSVKWDPFPALSAFSLSALNFHPEDPVGTLELGRAFLVAPGSAEAAAQPGPGAHVLLAGAGSVPAPGAGHPDSREIGHGAAAS